MAKINTPVKGFTGTVVGVNFADGVGETEDAGKLAYFRRQGYTVEESAKRESKTVEIPEGKPEEKWTNAQLTAYAEREQIDLDGATKKGDIIAVLTKPSEPQGNGEKSEPEKDSEKK
ncbi:hypothetical protein [Paramicrobacterium agarici]|uniref:hypothetical protein n=1 Tax=Paramicrobacterium agarici TaxID=630514 RepID=UPI0011540934|nr:hypothetical protein [Microbacterium agarici]TQO23789.1 hypothetical protein FB385_2651 [Microbacterium agarici]